MYFKLIDLRKVFACVPRDLVSWALRKQKCLVKILQSIYRNAGSNIRVYGMELQRSVTTITTSLNDKKILWNDHHECQYLSETTTFTNFNSFTLFL